jgi:hypothetical protein
MAFRMRRGLAAICLAVGCSSAFGQVQLQIQALVQPAVVGAVPPDDANPQSAAIGDPWWDEAEAKRPAAGPAAGVGAQGGEAEHVEAGDGPADAAEMMRQQLRAQAEEYARILRQQGLMILRRELSLVRQTCPSLERQQRSIVLEAGRGAIDSCIDEQLRAAGEGRRRPAKPIDPERAVREALAAAVKANAAETELAAYETEHRLREDRRKAAVVAALVAEVDREAYLDDAERQALAKSLNESYRERWRPAVAALEQRGMVVPDESMLPGLERCVEKALGKERKARWVAARDEARKLAGPMGQMMHQAVMPAGPGGVGVVGIRRMIRRQGVVNGVEVVNEVQVEVQAGPPPESVTDPEAEEERK